MTNMPDLLSDMELANARNNLHLLRSQIRAGHLDESFLANQVDKLDQLLENFIQAKRNQAKNTRLETLYNVSRMLGSSLDLQTVLDQVMDAIIQLTGAERGFLMLRDDDGDIAVKAARNFDQTNLNTQDSKFSRTVTNQVMDTGKAILTTNATEDPRFAGQASIVAQSLRSVMATPLMARGTVIGVVYVDSRALAELFNDDDLDALEALSSQAAIALYNAQLFGATDEALNQRVDAMRQLRRIDLLLNETLDLDKAIAYTLEWACRLADATGGYLGLLEDNHVQCKLQQKGQEQNLCDAANDKYLDAIYPESLAVAQTGIPQTVEQNGQVLLFLPISREKLSGVVMLYRDASVHFEDEQRDLVERVVARAAVTIENAMLYKAVQEADSAKSEFVGIVAHDLKSPMTGIKGYADLLMMLGDLNNVQTEYLGKISDTVQRMEILVSDLADISRIESGHFYMEEMPVTVEAVVQTVYDSAMPEIQTRKHTFIKDIEPDLPSVWVDYYRLLQVLNNLVSNAYKYTPEGGKIKLSVRQNGANIEFSVIDSGIGLTAEQISLLGTKFWRADDKFTRSQPGTGLGFSITSRLVEQMGDQIHIESVPGKGSRFTFNVPIAKGDK